jgi:hypothetical protein
MNAGVLRRGLSGRIDRRRLPEIRFSALGTLGRELRSSRCKVRSVDWANLSRESFDGAGRR